MTQQLGPQDAQFLYLQTGENLTHVMGVYVYDPATAPGGKVRFKDIVRHIDSRSHTSPVFRRRLYRLPFDIDHPYWVEDPHFDLEAHITHVALPEPGDWRQFCIQVARHFSRPMDMNRPLWDIYVVEGLDRIEGMAPGSYALLHRIHHAAIDGVSGAHAFVALNDSDAHGTPAVEPKEYGAEIGNTPSALEIAARAAFANATSPARLLNAAIRLSPALLTAAGKSFAERNRAPSGIPETRFNAPVSPHKMFDAVTLALKDLSAIRQLVEGSTINDVVIAICSGALRRYLTKHKELPKDTLVAVAPINARKRAGQADIPGNNISAMSVRLATDIADPVARLQAIRNFTAEAKEAKAGLSARVMTDLSKHIPGATMAGVARLLTSERFAPRQANLFISNVPGPQVPLYMNGARLTHQFGMAPLANNMGLFIAALSYNGTISFSITSDRHILPDIGYFRECIAAAFKELRHLKPATAKTKKAAARAS
ncbi:MAG: wax ester/triacylglycerol synthase family O-acyltransferase [Alphaproteobacteria bacterium]|nr:wax ester/triacylglycerol synthase family O-acyltransferase [Alphaproteobacteria bacterium]